MNGPRGIMRRLQQSLATHHQWAAALGGLLLFLATVGLAAEDVVVISSAADSAQQTRRVGEIIDYTGRELTLRMKGDREVAIPSERVIDVHTRLSQDQQRADQLFAARRYAESVDLYRQAQNQEERIWMRRQIVAQQVWCHRNLQQYDRAAELFLVLFQSDPDTQFIGSIPLAWRTQQPPASLERRATGWLRGNLGTREEKRSRRDLDAVAALIGASWLLPTSLRGESVVLLEQLKEYEHQVVARLAQAQLWRSQVMAATRDDVAAWQVAADAFPPALRAGPYFVIGQALARHGRHEEAALMWMRVPIVFSRHRVLASECLLAAGDALAKTNQLDEAANVYREVVRDYAELPVASVAKSKLAEY